MSHTNKFTRNARLRRFAPGSAPAENSASRNFVGPPPAPPADRCTGYACSVGEQPGGGLLREMGHVQFAPGRVHRNRGFEAHRPLVFGSSTKPPKIIFDSSASFQNQNMTEEQRQMEEEQLQRARAFDITENRAKMKALMAASDVKARGGSLEEQTLVFLATLSAKLEEYGVNEDTRKIILEDSRKDRNMQDPKKRRAILNRRKNYRKKYTKKKNKNKNENGYNENSN